MSKPPLVVGSVTFGPVVPRGHTVREYTGPREARFALDNCNEQQRRWIHSLGQLLTENPATFADLLAGRVLLTAQRDGTVAAIRTSPMPLPERRDPPAQPGF